MPNEVEGDVAMQPKFNPDECAIGRISEHLSSCVIYISLPYDAGTVVGANYNDYKWTKLVIKV